MEGLEGRKAVNVDKSCLVRLSLRMQIYVWCHIG